jgi:hypothetical protein
VTRDWLTYTLRILEHDASVNALTRSARALGRAHGGILSRRLVPPEPPPSMHGALAACRLLSNIPLPG